MEEILEEIPRITASIQLATKESLGTELNLEDTENILAKWDKVEEFLELLKPKGIYGYFPRIAEFPDSDTDLLWFSNTERVLLDCFSDEGMEKSLKTEDLGNFLLSIYFGISCIHFLVRNFVRLCSKFSRLSIFFVKDKIPFLLLLRPFASSTLLK